MLIVLTLLKRPCAGFGALLCPATFSEWRDAGALVASFFDTVGGCLATFAAAIVFLIGAALNLASCRSDAEVDLTLIAIHAIDFDHDVLAK